MQAIDPICHCQLQILSPPFLTWQHHYENLVVIYILGLGVSFAGLQDETKLKYVELSKENSCTAMDATLFFILLLYTEIVFPAFCDSELAPQAQLYATVPSEINMTNHADNTIKEQNTGGGGGGGGSNGGGGGGGSGNSWSYGWGWGWGSNGGGGGGGGAGGSGGGGGGGGNGGGGGGGGGNWGGGGGNRNGGGGGGSGNNWGGGGNYNNICWWQCAGSGGGSGGGGNGRGNFGGAGGSSNSGDGWGNGGGGGGGTWGRQNGRGRVRRHRPSYSSSYYRVGEYAMCTAQGRCQGMRLLCPMHCEGPCFYDCDSNCRAHCRF